MFKFALPLKFKIQADHDVSYLIWSSLPNLVITESHEKVQNMSSVKRKIRLLYEKIHVYHYKSKRVSE